MICPNPPHSIAARVSGFMLLIALLILTAAGKAVLYDTLDPDLWWHIRVGEQLQRDGVGPIVDTLSFTSIKTPWTPYSWLAEIGMAQVWKLGGLRAAVAGQAVLVALFYTFITLTCLEVTRRPRPYVGIVLAVVFAEYLTLPFLSFRPATLSLMLLSLCAWLIARDRRLFHRSSSIWWLIPISIVNVNVHLFAIFVPVLAGAAMIDVICERYRGDRSAPLGRAIAITVGTSLSLCLTPMLPGVISSLFNYTAADPMVASNAIAELRPFWSGSIVSITSAMLLSALICFVINRRLFGPGVWLGTALGFAAICRMGRLSPIFVVIAAPMLAMCLTSLRGRVLGRPLVTGLIAIIVCVGTVRMIQQFPTHQTTLAQWLNRNGPETPGYPCGATEFVARTIVPVRGRIVNDFNWGGYLAWQLGPRFQVFMDPRTQLYTPAFWNQTCLTDDRSTAAAIETANADAAIVPAKSRRLLAAVKSLGWKRVYCDDRASVYVPNDSPVASIGD